MKRDSERGVALLEFAIVLPALVLLTVVSIDLGRMLTLYLDLQQFVHAGLRLAQSTPNLAPGEVDGYIRASDYLPVVPAGAPPTHVHVQIRIRNAVFSARQLGSFQLDGNDLQIKTKYTNVLGAPDENAVTVIVETIYPAIMKAFLGDMRMRASASGPYLS